MNKRKRPSQIKFVKYEWPKPNMLWHTDWTVCPFTGFHLRVIAALIKRCSIFINTDSGLGHIAASLNVPTFTIFGPANPLWTRPYNKKAVVIRKGLPCQPCNGKLDVCKGRIDCLRDLTPEEVFKVIVKNL